MTGVEWDAYAVEVADYNPPAGRYKCYTTACNLDSKSVPAYLNIRTINVSDVHSVKAA
jgi:hypothetical protein